MAYVARFFGQEIGGRRRWGLITGLALACMACFAYAQSPSPNRASPKALQDGSTIASVTIDTVETLSNDEPDPDAFDNRDAQRFYERVFRRLKRMKTYDDKKQPSNDDPAAESGSIDSFDLSTDESLDPTLKPDNFVIGTAAVHPTTQNADVCFRAISGIDKTAREITRVHGETLVRGEISYWQVFYRVDAAGSSEELLAQLQRRYDETLAYRNQLMYQYNARTIRRC